MLFILLFFICYVILIHYIDTLLLLTIKRKSKLEKKTTIICYSFILSPCLFPYPPPPSITILALIKSTTPRKMKLWFWLIYRVRN